VACGKCVEVCPAGAAKLGQKLCTKDGPIQYPKQELPDDNQVGRGKVEQELHERQRAQLPRKRHRPLQVGLPRAYRHPGLHQDGRRRPYQDALKLIKKDNPFPAVCGSICNRKYCEDECTRGTWTAPSAIDEIKKFLAEQELNEKDRYIPPKVRPRHQSGLCGPEDRRHRRRPCRHVLRLLPGRDGLCQRPVVFENKVPGGMLALGIPSFRLDKNVSTPR
jgi:NAD-dependent dihydropyrimidine dehydrogenase PreA subunit